MLPHAPRPHALMLMPSCSCPHAHALVLMPLVLMPSCSCRRIHALVLMPSYSCPRIHAFVLMPFITYLLVWPLFMCRVNCYPASIVLSLVFHGFVYVLPVWSFIKPLFRYIVHLGPTFFFHRLTPPNSFQVLWMKNSSTEPPPPPHLHTVIFIIGILLFTANPP